MSGPQLSDDEMQDLREKVVKFATQLSPAQREYLTAILSNALDGDDVQGYWGVFLGLFSQPTSPQVKVELTDETGHPLKMT